MPVIGIMGRARLALMHRTSCIVTGMFFVAALTAGCAGKDPMAVLFGSKSNTASVEGVFYAAEDRLVVRDAPTASARIIGHLERGHKVTRSGIENGFAHVRASGSNLQGWVVNAKLDWRSPAKPSETPTTSSAAPAAGSAPATEAELAPTDSGEAAPELAPGSVPEPVPGETDEAKPRYKPRDRSGAAVFDAY